MLSELIDKIEVYHAEIIDGVKTQRLNIHYNCVGLIEIPTEIQLSEPEVVIQTRRVVAVDVARVCRDYVRFSEWLVFLEEYSVRFISLEDVCLKQKQSADWKLISQFPYQHSDWWR